MSIRKKNEKQPKLYPRGFSIIELIITLSIFVTLATTLMLNYNTFNSQITLDTLANQIALWVRDAQVEAMSVKTSATSGAYSGYGIHFERSSPTQFIFFSDLNGNGVYDAGGVCGDAASECLKMITLQKGSTIVTLCGDITGTSVTSADCGLLDTSDHFDISFTRPSLDATITGNPGTGNVLYAHADITIASIRGYRRTIQAWTTGQISVQ